MTQSPSPSRGEPGLAGFESRRTLSLGSQPVITPDVANLLWDVFGSRVRGSGLSGFGVLMGREGLILRAQAFGACKKSYQDVAFMKVETVWARGRSTWEEFLYELNNVLYRDNFGGLVKTLFAGGVAIYADSECTELVGALAFSGGPQWLDHETCRRSVLDVARNKDLGAELFTDARELTDQMVKSVLTGKPV